MKKNLLCAVILFFSVSVHAQIMNCDKFCVLNIGIDTSSNQLEVTIYNGDTNHVNYPTVYVVGSSGDTVGNISGTFVLFAHGAGDTITHEIPTTLDSLPAGFTGTVHFRDQVWDTSCAYSYPMICMPAGINEKFTPKVFVVYPNPSPENITIRFSAIGMKSITLYDYSGKAIQKHSTSEEDFELNREGLSNGLYFLDVIIDSKRYSQKVIFQ